MTMRPNAAQIASMLSIAFPGNKGVDLAAAELRRLQEVNTELLEALQQLCANELHTQEKWDNARDALAKATRGTA
jgi:hypothetical protein